MLPLLIVIIVIVAVAVAAIVAFRRFERYRYTEAWRKSEFRGWAFGFLMWFGGLFGHRIPPPPQTKVEFVTRAKDGESPPSGGAPLPDQAPDDKQ